MVLYLYVFNARDVLNFLWLIIFNFAVIIDKIDMFEKLNNPN